MLRGLPRAYEELLANLRELDVQPPLVTSGMQVGSVLTYMYGMPTIELGSREHWGIEESTTQRVLGRGELAGLPAVGLDAFELRGPPLRSMTFVGEYLEMTQGRRPRAIVDFPLPLHLGFIGGSSYEVEVEARHPRFYSSVGAPQPDGSLRVTGAEGLLHAGPCVSLSEGTYEVDWLGSVETVGPAMEIGRVEFVYGAQKKLGAERIARARPTGPGATFLAGLEFTLPVPVSCAELRFWSRRDSSIMLSALRLRRVAER
jgi:hypothetical protein